MVGEEETLQATSYETSASDTDEWDVDAYNRRYSPDEAYAEEASLGEDQIVERTQTAIEEEPERRSDLEYTERIIRYHSPSKISIVGADQVDLYLDDGYYAYDYGTDYSDGYTNVSVNPVGLLLLLVVSSLLLGLGRMVCRLVRSLVRPVVGSFVELGRLVWRLLGTSSLPSPFRLCSFLPLSERTLRI